jgi:hypothetical protein
MFMGNRSVFQPGNEVFIIHENRIKEAVFLNFTETNKCEIRILPHFQEMIVTKIYETRKRAEDAFRISQNRNAEKTKLQVVKGYSVCEQCGSVTTTGKSCECSRWA